jgi:hypothetical protein
MAMSSRLIAISAAGLLIAGCQSVANKNIGSEDPAMGEAVKYNAAVQVINPDPVYPEDGAQPGDSGEKGAKAVERYRNDEVNARHRTEANANKSGSLSTTSGSGGGPR